LGGPKKKNLREREKRLLYAGVRGKPKKVGWVWAGQLGFQEPCYSEREGVGFWGIDPSKEQQTLLRPSSGRGEMGKGSKRRNHQDFQTVVVDEET